jgi:hypothetical protein
MQFFMKQNMVLSSPVSVYYEHGTEFITKDLFALKIYYQFFILLISQIPRLTLFTVWLV